METDFVEFFVSGKRVILDKADEAFIQDYDWSLNRKGYLKTNVRKGSGWTTAYLTRLLVNAPKGMVVDHIDGDIYNNRRSNLRICTQTQNARNCRKKKPSSGGFKGVYDNRYGRFVAMIRVNSKLIGLGTFDTALEAASAYNEAAMLHFGEFASLNRI